MIDRTPGKVVERLHRGQSPLAALGILYGFGYIFIPKDSVLPRGIDILATVPLWIPGSFWLIGGLLCLRARWRRTVSPFGIGLIVTLLMIWGGFYMLGAVESILDNEVTRSYIGGGLHLAVAWLIVDGTKAVDGSKKDKRIRWGRP